MGTSTATPPRAAPGPSAPRLGHVGALDGLRGLALLAVLAYHLDSKGLPAGGSMGVDLFFGLSGFLITTLLVERFGPAARRAGGQPGQVTEQPGGRPGGHAAAAGRALRDFYARRARRLLPALVVFLVGYLLVGLVAGRQPWFGGVPGQTWPGSPVSPADLVHAEVGVLGYFSNLAITFGWVWGQGAPIGHLWTLAVEGQFYVGWGLLLVAVLRAARGRRRAGLWIAGALAVGLAGASVATTAMVWHAGAGAHDAYFATWTRGQGLLLGSAAGLWWSGGGVHRLVACRWGRAVSSLLILAAGGWLVAAVFVVPGAGPAVPAVTGTAALSVACALLVVLVSARPTGWLARFLRAPVLRYVGRRSYALYLWHYPLLAWFRGDGALGAALAVGLAFGAAELSWRLVEHPILARGRLLPRRAPAPQITVPRAGPGPVGERTLVGAGR